MTCRCRMFMVGLLCLVGMMSARAEVYQWRDEQGKLHFSDKKPMQQPAEDISQRLGVINVDQSHSQRLKLQRLFKPETAAEKAHLQRQLQQEEQQRARREEQCRQAHRYLELLRGPVFFEREDGSTFDISEAERQQKVAEVASQIRQYCP